MVPFVAALWAGLAATVVPMAVRLLIGIGFTTVTYTGISLVYTNVQNAIWANLGSVSASVLTIITMARIDDAIQIVLSTGVGVLLLKGLNLATGAVTRGSWKAPAAPP